jgi:hypothetical protein
MHNIINDFAGQMMVLGFVWYAAQQALVEWRDWAIGQLNSK